MFSTLILLGLFLISYILFNSPNDMYLQLLSGLGKFMSGIGTLGLLAVAVFKLPKEIEKFTTYYLSKK